MNRREFLKISSIAALGAAAGLKGENVMAQNKTENMPKTGLGQWLEKKVIPVTKKPTSKEAA